MAKVLYMLGLCQSEGKGLLSGLLDLYMSIV